MSERTASSPTLASDESVEPVPASTIEPPESLFHKPPTIIILAWVVRVSALLNLIAAFFRQVPETVHWLGRWAPFEISDGRSIRMVLTSLLLFILASGLAKGKRLAWILTMCTFAIAPVLHYGRTDILPQAIVNICLIGFLYLHRRYFIARSDRQAVRSALLICSLLGVGLLAFGTVRLHQIRDETGGDDDWGSCFQTALELVLVQNTLTQVAQTPGSFNFFSILRIGGMTIAVTGLYLMMRPVILLSRRQSEQRDRVRALIERYGKDSLDPYALLPDKEYFFAKGDRTVIPYAVSGKMAVALANPIGPRKQLESSIDQFGRYCREHDWEPVFSQVTEEMRDLYEKAGFSVLKIGEEACIQTERFNLQGTIYQNLRTLRNRGHRLGLQFRWYDPSEGIDEALENQLAAISHNWLVQKKAREMSFDMGTYSPEQIRRNGAAVATDGSGRALAFTTWHSFAQEKGRVLDLMRAPRSERNVIDFVIIESIFHFRTLGVEEVSLGSAPLANADEDADGFEVEEKAVQFLFENLNRIYGYKSLFEFKRKYRPQWKGRYVAYRRGGNLPMVGLALVRIHAPDGIWKFLRG